MDRPIILIVDDIEDNRLVLKRTLYDRKDDFEFMEAANGKDAFKKALMYNPSLIIMDLMMPVMDGFEAIRTIRANDSIVQMPILVLTALDSTEDKVKALSLGATDFIAKPFDFTDLKARVDALTTFHLSLLKKEEELRDINETLTVKVDEKSKALQQTYLTDPMTALPNRSKLLRDIEKDEVESLMIIDVDAFSDITNFYGSKTGDELLIQIAMRLARLCLIDHACHDLYRLGGDVFAVTLGEKDIHTLAEAIQKSVKGSPFSIFDNHEINIFVTIGAALPGENLLHRAEMALKEAKSKKEDFRLYTENNALIKQYETNMLWTKKILQAIVEDKILPHFQPIVNLKTGLVEKYESLMRLMDSDGTIHAPGFFLDVAKRSKLYPQLTCIMLKKSFDVFKERDTEFSINISSEDITNETVVREIYRNLAAFPHKENVVFELLESDGIQNYDAVITFIDTVKAHGCKIALDDFGSGYSNFSHILKLNVDYIKIDGSLIRDIHNDPHAKAVVETIIGFSQKLGFQTVAEFVHCQEVMDTVRALGVDYVQGYHCGKPSDIL